MKTKAKNRPPASRGSHRAAKKRPQHRVDPSSPVITELPLDAIRIDGGTQPREEISAPVVGEYAEQMAAGVAFPPITVFHHADTYWLADGFHRYQAALAVKHDRIRAEVRGGTLRDAILCAVGANASHGLPRSNADKRRAVSLLLTDEEWRQRSDKWIARQCAVSDRFVATVRGELSVNGSQTRIVERKGALYEMAVGGFSRNTPDGVQAATAEDGGGSENYDSDAWCTPAFLIEMAREVLGEIDIDPASNEFAQKTVQAKCWYGQEDDGRTKPWPGRGWLNAPYSMPLVEQFVDKLLEEYDVGQLTAALAIFNNNTETEWCQKVLRRFPACFPDRRIPFEHPERDASGTRQGQVIFYLGGDVELFAQVFSRLGTVVTPRFEDQVPGADGGR